jgi:hypothetical protein
MKRNIETALLCIIGSAIAFLIGYAAFAWGFERGAHATALIVQTQATGSANASQAYQDSGYYLEPTYNPQNVYTSVYGGEVVQYADTRLDKNQTF